MSISKEESRSKNYIRELNKVQAYTNKLESCLLIHHTLIYFLLQNRDLPWGSQISQGICESNSDIYDLFTEMQTALNSAVFELKNNV